MTMPQPTMPQPPALEPSRRRTAYPAAFVDTARAALPRARRPAGDPVTDADLAVLPEPARRYMRFVGAAARPRDRATRARF